MEFLTISRRRTEAFSQEEFEKYLDAEAEEARRLYSEGIVRRIWSRLDVPGAIMLVEAESEQTASAALQRLPLVAKGMLEAQIVPLKGYRGFGPRS